MSDIYVWTGAERALITGLLILAGLIGFYAGRFRG